MIVTGINKVQLQHYNNEKQLNQKLSWQLENILKSAVNARGQAYLAVSGGKSPKGLFQILSNANLPWENIVITLTDERCLEPTSLESNEYLIRTNLLQNKAKHAQFIPIYGDARSQNVYLSQIEEKIASLPLFDAVVLGMGTDGHTASLFPCSPEIKDSLTTKDALICTNPSSASYQRISMTMSRLLQSEVIFLYLVGNEKLNVLNRALSGDDVLEMPIRAFLQNEEVPVKIQFAP